MSGEIPSIFELLLFYWLLLVSLTCVVLHHVLVVSVGGLGQVHAGHPHGGVPPACEEAQLSPRVHQGLPSQRGEKLLSLGCGVGHHIPVWLLKMLTCCLILPAATQWNKSGLLATTTAQI